MRSLRHVGLMALVLVIATSLAGAAEIRGTYVEARNAEVYTSHCFANSELGQTGNLAVMTWRIDEGAWNNVSLDGLGVVAVVRARTTLGDPFNSPYPAKAVLIFDERASDEQRAALEGLAKQMGGGLIETRGPPRRGADPACVRGRHSRAARDRGSWRLGADRDAADPRQRFALPPR